MKKELKIGIIMVVALGFLIWGANFLKGKNFFSSTVNYIVVYDDVSGLLESNGVFVKGYKVGHVRDIAFSDKTLKTLRVVLAIERDIKVAQGSLARIYSLDFIGNKGVELVLADNKNYLTPNDTLLGDIEISVAKQIEPYKIQAYNLLNSLDSLSNSILRVFNPATVRNITGIIKSLKITTESIAEGSEDIKNTFVNIESVSKNLMDNNRRVSEIIKDLQTFSDTLSKVQINHTLNKMNSLLDKSKAMIENLEQGKGTLGKLIKNDTLYYNLNKATIDLDSLINDIKANPNRYVRVSVFGSSK